MNTAPGRQAWIQAAPHHRKDIEGLRALAILVVVAFHAGIPGFGGGFVGVDVFFVLSGYLITWLLVHEAEKGGGIDLKRFYARRARRLLPAMAVMLLVTLVATAVLYAPFEHRMLAPTWAATALYVSNISFAKGALDYHGPSAKTNPLLHTWSLSVEEQFYLVWPWIVLLGLQLLKWQRERCPHFRWGLPILLGSTIVWSFAGSLYLTYFSGAWAFYLAPTRAWEFAAGGLAVLLPRGQSYGRWASRSWARNAAVLVGWFALAGLGVATAVYDSATPFPGVAALLPVLSTVVLLQAGSAAPASSASATHLLSLRPLQSIGRLSYSWYLWHWPVLVFGAALAEPFGRSGRVGASCLALIPAYLSYKYVETPIRQSPTLGARASRSLAMAAGMALGGVVLSALWWRASISWNGSETQARFVRARELPTIYQDGCDNFGRADLTECEYGERGWSRTVVLVGDSHAGQFFPPLRSAALATESRLVVLTLSACPLVDISVLFNSTLGRPYPECVQWRTSALEAIRRLKPDLTFVATATQYDVPSESWEAGTSRVLRRLVAASRRVVLIQDPPPAGVDVPACLARAAWRPGDALDPDCRLSGHPAGPLAAAQERSARSIPAVEILQLRDYVCPVAGCEATQDGLVRYRDAGHLSVEFALSLDDLFVGYLAAPPTEPHVPTRDKQ